MSSELERIFTLTKNRKPDFQNILRVLKHEPIERPVLFEFFMNQSLYESLADQEALNSCDEFRKFRIIMSAFRNAGYDYATIPASYSNILKFDRASSEQKNSRSQNDGFVITDRESFNAYQWPDPDERRYDLFAQLESLVPEGMKLIPSGPGGLLENAIDLVGFENLCFMSMMDEDLCRSIFDSIGERLLSFYSNIASYESVGAVIYNDDWGFKTQTMFSPEMLRSYVFPWCKKITQAVHAHGKPVILHSCGNLNEIMDDIIDGMKFDGKHSFEDIIIPVEAAIKKWSSRIAIMGGIDMNFISTASPQEVSMRSKLLLEQTQTFGGYALGSGNSIADYVPVENYFAMVLAALDR